MFSKACEYAIRAALYISIKSVNGSRLSIPEIAKQIDAPVPFTAKILQTLVRKRIVSSIKGPNGGFYLDPKAKPVSLASIVKAIDGSDDALHVCTLGLKECSDAYPCPIHHEVKPFKDHIRKIMRETNLQELSDGLVNGETFLKNSRKK
ncbi:MAG: Rrf2 family transcriptional regulator [Cyclobacteriaceae bacterium]|nr:Rrf2 family transcriptional regulator [Cyclobacteriaceae bacterium]